MNALAPPLDSGNRETQPLISFGNDYLTTLHSCRGSWHALDSPLERGWLCQRGNEERAEEGRKREARREKREERAEREEGYR
jgi:hypothetical protein